MPWLWAGGRNIASRSLPSAALSVLSSPPGPLFFQERGNYRLAIDDPRSTPGVSASQAGRSTIFRSGPMKVVLQTPSQLVVHEGVLKTVVLGTIFVAVGGGMMTLRLANQSGWSGNAGPWLIYLVGGVFVAVGLASLLLSADRRFVFDRSTGTVRFFFFKQKTAYEIGLGIPAEPLFRSFAFTLRVRAGNTDVLTDAEENVRQKLRAEGVM